MSSASNKTVQKKVIGTNATIFDSKKCSDRKGKEEGGNPVWLSQMRNLKKVNGTTKPSEVKSSFTSTSSSTRKELFKSTQKDEGGSIDLITSSYGVGPTDGNGVPLFGLKALRTQNKSDTTKGKILGSQMFFLEKF